jgi:hypothetical protein
MTMKRIAVAAIFLGAIGMVIPAQVARAQVSVNVSIGGFYDELSPYGEWVDCNYGDCWVPRGVAAGWQPYSNGQWIYTRYGWTWVSNDPWGGNPYHYGTWTFVDRYGWAWVPGTVWAPAWVTWSYSNSYVGWAPMPPTVVFGSSGYSGRPVVVNEARYVFVPTNRFVGTNVMSVRVEPRRNAEIFRQAKPVTRFGVSGGIVTNAALPMATVQRAMGSRKIETREISTAHTTPRTFTSGGGGKSGHVAIVAPARDLKAARASRQAAPHAATKEPQHQQQAKPQQHQEQVKPQQHQQQVKPQQHEQAKPEQHQQQAKPQQHEQAKPEQHQQQAKPQQHEQAKPEQHQQQAKPQQHEQAKPEQHQQQAKPQQHEQAKPEQHRQQAKPQQHEQAKPDGKEKGQEQNKEKQDQPGKGEPHESTDRSPA